MLTDLVCLLQCTECHGSVQTRRRQAHGLEEEKEGEERPQEEEEKGHMSTDGARIMNWAARRTV